MSSVSGGELKWRVLSARRWCAQHSLTARLQRCPARGRGMRKARGSTGLPSSFISAVKISSATSKFIRKPERAAEQNSPFSAWEAFTVPFIEIRKQNLKWGFLLEMGLWCRCQSRSRYWLQVQDAAGVVPGTGLVGRCCCPQRFSAAWQLVPCACDERRRPLHHPSRS